MTTTNLQTRKWVYKIRGKYLYLFEIDSNEDLVPPESAVTDGLKIQYATGDKVFVDSSGDDDTSPDESSYINAPDSFKDAIIAFVKSRLAEDEEAIDRAEYWRRKYRIEFSRANEAQNPGPRVVVPIRPFAIR